MTLDDNPTADSDDPIVLARVAHDTEAAIIVNALKRRGLFAKSAGEFTAGFRAEAPGDVKILVRKSEMAAAREVLEDIRSDEEIDWSKVDVGDPES